MFVEKQYVLEEITEAHNKKEGKDIQVLRLPIGLSELNPIELIWARVKNEVARKNHKFNIIEVQKLTNEALENVTPESMRACEEG